MHISGKLIPSQDDNFEMEENLMSRKEANTDIRCNVESCAFHCGEQNYCSLRSINVVAPAGGNTGMPQDESMCGSYKMQ